MRLLLVMLLLPLGCPQPKPCRTCTDDNDSVPLGVTISPGEGAVEVGRLPRITLTFDSQMDAGATASALVLAGDDGIAIVGTTFFEANDTRLVLIPVAPLVADAVHTITLASGAYVLGSDVVYAARTSWFRTTASADGTSPVVTADAVDVTVSAPDLDAAGEFTLSGSIVGEELDWVGIEVVPATMTTVGHWAAATVADGRWTYAWQPPADLEGNATLAVMAVSRAGQQAQATATMRVDVQGPAAPIAPLPATTKFKTLTVEVQSEPFGALAVMLDGFALAGSPFDTGEQGVVSLVLSLPELVTVAVTLQPYDAEGNPGTPLQADVARTGYTCLAAGTFPVSDDAVQTLVDDEEGHVEVTYRLDTDLIDDTTLSEAAPSSNSGLSSVLGLGSGPGFRILLGLADEVMPSCAGVTKATLTLRGVAPCSGCSAPVSIAAYPLRRDWTERDATWESTGVAAWEVVGADGADDRASEALPSTLVINDLEVELSTGNVVIVAQDTGSRTFYSSEHADSNLRPTLQLELVEPAE